MAACKKIANHPGVLRFQDFSINTDVIVLSTPEIAGLPYVISGLVAAGGLAAALSTADGLLLAIANALSHDVYYKMIQPLENKKRTIVIGAIVIAVVGGLFWFTAIPSPLYGIQWRWLLLGGLAVMVAVIFPFWGKANDVEKRLIIARALLLLVAVAAASLASTRPSDILAMVGWAFSLAMAGNFPALTLGIWWKRATTTGAICGILAGWGICLFYLVTSRYFPQAGVTYFGMSSLLNPETGQAVVDVAEDHGRSEVAGGRARQRGEPDGQQGRLVRPQQHQLRTAGNAARLPGDHRRQPVDQGAVQGDAGLHRRDPQAARQDGAGGKDLLIVSATTIESGAFGPRFLFGGHERRPCCG